MSFWSGHLVQAESSKNSSAYQLSKLGRKTCWKHARLCDMLSSVRSVKYQCDTQMHFVKLDMDRILNRIIYLNLSLLAYISIIAIASQYNAKVQIICATILLFFYFTQHFGTKSCIYDRFLLIHSCWFG